jgi:hypothetical protein
MVAHFPGRHLPIAWSRAGFSGRKRSNQGCGSNGFDGCTGFISQVFELEGCCTTNQRDIGEGNRLSGGDEAGKSVLSVLIRNRF